MASSGDTALLILGMWEGVNSQEAVCLFQKGPQIEAGLTFFHPQSFMNFPKCAHGLQQPFAGWLWTQHSPLWCAWSLALDLHSPGFFHDKWFQFC